MSGPFPFGDAVGAIGSFGINARPEINGSIVQMRINFVTVNDEAVFPIVIGTKLTGKDVSCVGRNESDVHVCKRAEPLKPNC